MWGHVTANAAVQHASAARGRWPWSASLQRDKWSVSVLAPEAVKVENMWKLLSLTHWLTVSGLEEWFPSWLAFKYLYNLLDFWNNATEGHMKRRGCSEPNMTLFTIILFLFTCFSYRGLLPVKNRMIALSCSFCSIFKNTVFSVTQAFWVSIGEHLYPC